MSVGLIDYIFENLDVSSLDRKQVFHYLDYLNEIADQEKSLHKIIKYYSHKVSLQNRLVTLDQELVNIASSDSSFEQDTDKSNPAA